MKRDSYLMFEASNRDTRATKLGRKLPKQPSMVVHLCHVFPAQNTKRKSPRMAGWSEQEEQRRVVVVCRRRRLWVGSGRTPHDHRWLFPELLLVGNSLEDDAGASRVVGACNGRGDGGCLSGRRQL
jgi:hypothetical protein